LAIASSIPSNLYPTRIYTLEYDGFADFPRYPIDVFSDLNAAFGIVETHGLYLSIPSTVVANAIPLPVSEPTLTNYYMIPLSALPYPENYLPLLQPLLSIPVVGKPLADLLQPDLMALVNWGYGDPNFGWSTSPADIPTQFGFLPPLSATTALGPLLVSGTQKGVNAFVSDLQNLPLSSLVPAASPSSLPSLTDQLTALSTAASEPGATLTHVVNAFSSAAASLSTVGLQTADILNAGVSAFPPTTSVCSWPTSPTPSMPSVCLSQRT
jgi:PE-PPE domain